MEGYVRKIFLEKGFAFVEGSDERDYFLHWSKVSRNSVPFRNMKENDKVSFEFEEGTNGPKAFNVLVVRNQPKGDANGGTEVRASVDSEVNSSPGAEGSNNTDVPDGDRRSEGSSSGWIPDAGSPRR